MSRNSRATTYDSYKYARIVLSVADNHFAALLVGYMNSRGNDTKVLLIADAIVMFFSHNSNSSSVRLPNQPPLVRKSRRFQRAAPYQDVCL